MQNALLQRYNAGRTNFTFIKKKLIHVESDNYAEDKNNFNFVTLFDTLAVKWIMLKVEVT